MNKKNFFIQMILIKNIYTILIKKKFFIKKN